MVYDVVISCSVQMLESTWGTFGYLLTLKRQHITFRVPVFPMFSFLVMLYRYILNPNKYASWSSLLYKSLNCFKMKSCSLLGVFLKQWINTFQRELISLLGTVFCLMYITPSALCFIRFVVPISFLAFPIFAACYSLGQKLMCPIQFQSHLVFMDLPNGIF
jgi:hypothetical protein